jgi:hypothetical protein
MSFVFKYLKEKKAPKTLEVLDLKSVNIQALDTGKYEIEQLFINHNESSTHKNKNNTKKDVNKALQAIISALKVDITEELTLVQSLRFESSLDQDEVFMQAQYDGYTVRIILQTENVTDSPIFREIKKVFQYLVDYYTDQMVVAAGEKVTATERKLQKKEAKI